MKRFFQHLLTWQKNVYTKFLHQIGSIIELKNIYRGEDIFLGRHPTYKSILWEYCILSFKKTSGFAGTDNNDKATSSGSF